jgi:hypothetical protein
MTSIICVYVCAEGITLLSQYVIEFLIYTALNNNKKLRGLSPQARTIPTERPPLVGEVSANFSG